VTSFPPPFKFAQDTLFFLKKEKDVGMVAGRMNGPGEEI
jgi:hypothetical protein